MEPQRILPHRADMSAVLETVRARLAAYESGARGDHADNPAFLPPAPYRQAAVLILLVRRGEECGILFTRRAPHLALHAGQISFPGGGADAGDADTVATALREAKEEIGLDAGCVTVLGTLDRYITRTGFSVTPVVAVAEGAVSFNPDASEVAEIFEVPLEDVLRPGALQQKTATYLGAARTYEELTWQGFRIWGATAGMLRNFVDVVGPL